MDIPSLRRKIGELPEEVTTKAVLVALEEHIERLSNSVGMYQEPASGGEDREKKLVADVRQLVAEDRQQYQGALFQQAKQELGMRVEAALRWYGSEGIAAQEVLNKALDAWVEAGMPATGTRPGDLVELAA